MLITKSRQTTLSEATLLPMGKGFAITSDLNLGQMLLAGYAPHINSPLPIANTNNSKATQSSNTRPTSRLPRIRIAAITNDTVATFASLAYIVQSTPHSRVAMGLIVGTGTNATVPMKPSFLHPSKIKELANPEAVDTVVINTEWTIRGTDKPLIDLGIKTKWDLELDSKSEAPGFQPFEYMTAGRYLGELVRIVFVDVVAKEKNGTASTSTSLPPSLLVRNALPTRFLAEVVARADEASLTSQLEAQFASASLETPFWNLARAQLIKRITYAVQQRSSALIAAACIGLLACVHDIDIDIDIDSPSQTPQIPQLTSTNNVNTSTTEELVIAYAGGTISQYPEWLATCQKWIDTLVTQVSRRNAKKRVVLREALDGGIVGAGVLAAMADGIM
jgi:hexokinase